MTRLCIHLEIHTADDSRPTCNIAYTSNHLIKDRLIWSRLCDRPNNDCVFTTHNELHIFADIDNIGRPTLFDFSKVHFVHDAGCFQSPDYTGDEWEHISCHSQYMAFDEGVHGARWEMIVDMDLRPKNRCQFEPILSFTSWNEAFMEELSDYDDWRLECFRDMKVRQSDSAHITQHQEGMRNCVEKDDNSVNSGQLGGFGNITSGKLSDFGNPTQPDRSRWEPCEYCKHTGHTKANCKFIDQPSAWRCTYEACGKIGHTEDRCRIKTQDRDKKRAQDAKRNRPAKKCDHCNTIGHTKDVCRRISDEDAPRCTYEPCARLGHTENQCRLKVFHASGGSSEEKKGKGKDIMSKNWRS